MVQIKSTDNSITFTYGGIDQDGDAVIYVDSNAETVPTPIILEANSGADILQNLYWDDVHGLWVIEHGAVRGQLL